MTSVDQVMNVLLSTETYISIWGGGGGCESPKIPDDERYNAVQNIKYISFKI